MPAAPPVAFATLAAPLPAPRSPIVAITPTTLSNHLVLSHGTETLTLADNQSLQALHTLRGHERPVTAVACEAGNIFSAGKDALVVQWDERTRRAAAEIKAEVNHALPLSALAVHALDHLVIGGTELVGSAAYILFWDTRNTAEPAYVHESTHADDITHLSIPPPTATFAKSGEDRKLPSQLLLSASRDGCVALSDLRESGDEESLEASASPGGAITAAGSYTWKGGFRVWARTDADAVVNWSVGSNDAYELEFSGLTETKSDQFKKNFMTPKAGPSVVHAPLEERPYPQVLQTENLVAVCPSLGVGKTGRPMVGVSTNEGNIVIQHAAKDEYTPSAFFVSGPGLRGHKATVQSMLHAVRDEAVYTGSADGVLCGWSLASLPRLVCGDPDVDNDGGDGRESIGSDDESEESEIETEESESDRSDTDDDDNEDDDEGPRHARHGPVYGGGKW